MFFFAYSHCLLVSFSHLLFVFSFLPTPFILYIIFANVLFFFFVYSHSSYFSFFRFFILLVFFFRYSFFPLHIFNLFLFSLSTFSLCLLLVSFPHSCFFLLINTFLFSTKYFPSFFLSSRHIPCLLLVPLFLTISLPCSFPLFLLLLVPPLHSPRLRTPYITGSSVASSQCRIVPLTILPFFPLPCSSLKHD